MKIILYRPLIYHLKKYFWPEEEIVVAHSCRKRKKLICGTEGEIVVAHGRLPSPALKADEQSFGRHFLKKIMIIVSVDGTASITSSDK